MHPLCSLLSYYCHLQATVHSSLCYSLCTCILFVPRPHIIVICKPQCIQVYVIHCVHASSLFPALILLSSACHSAFKSMLFTVYMHPLCSLLSYYCHLQATVHSSLCYSLCTCILFV